MTIDDHPIHQATRPTARRTRIRTITRVLLTSMAVGAASALALTLVVFPGATEAVIAGSLLLSGGLGWAALEFMSRRRSDEPQPWARVPAVAMSASGVALIVLAPQHGTLAVLTWVWPLPMVALVAWMVVKSRRAMSRRPRRLLLPVFAGLGLIAIGAGVHGITAAGVTSAPGEVHSVGDHRLHIDCRGSGSPTVVLFNGMGEFSGSWARVVDRVAPSTRVCAYDRVGQGWSDDVDGPQDAIEAAADLRALLAAAGEVGPFVLAGHSVGGPYSLVFAEQYPEDVAGVVLLDSTSPRQFTEIEAYGFQYGVMRRATAVMPVLTRIGLIPAATPVTRTPDSDPQGGDAMASTVRLQRNARDELAILPTVLEQAQGLSTLGDRPLEVVTATGSLGMKGWAEAQSRLARLSSTTSHREVESSHSGLVYDARGADASVAAIATVVSAVRSASHAAAS